MPDFEFYIDTNDAKAIYYRQPTYGVHDAKIIAYHISQLESNGLIRDCVEPWNDLLFLADK